MKKTYINPDVLVVKLNATQAILTGSVDSLKGQATDDMVGMGREDSYDWEDE